MGAVQKMIAEKDEAIKILQKKAEGTDVVMEEMLKEKQRLHEASEDDQKQLKDLVEALSTAEATVD